MAIRLKSRDQCPVNGFWVNVPHLNYNKQFWRFSDAVNALWDVLQGNPGVAQRFPDLPKSKEECADFIDRTNAARMMTIKGAQNFITDDRGQVLPKSVPPQPKSLSSGGGVVGAARKIAAGIAMLLPWLGRGGITVPSEQANTRAHTCTHCGPDGGLCPKNLPGDLTSFFTLPVAQRLRKQLEMRKDLKLETTSDANLGICDACGCPLKLKVHTPIEDIVTHMPDFVRRDLYSQCWILKENP